MEALRHYSNEDRKYNILSSLEDKMQGRYTLSEDRKYSTLTPMDSKMRLRHHQTDDRRYSTLTPLEAKKISKFMNVRQPQRTASVHYKPRPPPLVLSNGASVYKPTSISSNTNNNNNHHVDQSSLNKSDLSSSTTKVIQNHFSSFRKLLRYIPNRRSIADNNNSHHQACHLTTTTNTSSMINGENSLDNKQTLADSVTQLCLNRSHSPPVFPPPPNELKSMSYMESNIDYSNYDEFTRSRNQQHQQINKLPTMAPQKPPHDMNMYHHFDEHDSGAESSWQLTSLPLTLNRDLTTVFEEKTGLNNHYAKAIRHQQSNNNERYFIRPPACFDESRTAPPDRSGELDIRRSDPKTSSSYSLTSITTADSVLDYQQQLTSSFKIPCANKSPFEQSGIWNSSGLPPKMPIYETTNIKTSSCDISDHSGPMNGLNNCDQLKSLETDKSSNDSGRGEPANGCCQDADADTTIISNTSTLQGNSQTELDYRSRCAELEQQVNYLRDELVNKGKELTDLQLKLWSADYLIAKLKSDKGKLEKDNAQLKEAIFEANHRATM